MTIDPTTGLLTLFALFAFASNSVLTRLALGSHRVDAPTFTAVRLAAGAVVLALLVRGRAGTWRWATLRGRDTKGPLALFAYAAPFSFAYLRIGAAVGALVLFGTVQLSMIAYGLLQGERPTARAWVGLLMAAGGLAALTLPSAHSPDLLGVALMIIAGMAWAAYTLIGRATSDPLAANARSFLWSTPLALALIAVPHASLASSRGIALAVISGAVTSGLGYAVWYRALPRLSVMVAAVAQLCVPIIAAVAAAALLGEHLSTRLMISGAAVLSGVGLVLSARHRRPVLT
jgi:drug/metabolite transporter (DMT)-like permease